METVRNELARLPEVSGASFSFEIPDGASGGAGTMFKPSQDSTSGIIATNISTDEFYAATYNIPLVAGKFLTTAGNQFDPTLIVINESAAKGLGYQQPAASIGKKVRFTNVPIEFTIGGVMKDFHFGSMHDIIRPLYAVHVRSTQVYRYMSIKLKPGHIGRSLQTLQKKWAALMPGAPFEYTFMDDTLAQMYKSEIQMRKAAQAATTLALLIVLSGVLGIISISLARRVKELGIRKVLGASVPQIVLLFLKEFAWVVLIATLVACPLAWWLLNNWLMNFAYHIDIGPLPFLTVAGIMAGLTGLVITIQTIQKAWKNPVTSLRTE
jgi:putative ABC transport system permease protein